MGQKWPADADGDVLRRLEESGFDFARTYSVDFNIDFDNWPPCSEAVVLLNSRFSTVELIDPDEEDLEDGETNGWILIPVDGRVSYEFVTDTQQVLTELMRPFGGWCESWGVMHD